MIRVKMQFYPAAQAFQLLANRQATHRHSESADRLSSLSGFPESRAVYDPPAKLQNTERLAANSFDKSIGLKSLVEDWRRFLL
jgi:hypothetical protein